MCYLGKSSIKPTACVCRIQQLMLSNTLVKLMAVFLFATPAVLIGGELYSILQPDTSLWQGFLKIYSVLYIIPGWSSDTKLIMQHMGSNSSVCCRPSEMVLGFADLMGWFDLQD